MTTRINPLQAPALQASKREILQELREKEIAAVLEKKRAYLIVYRVADASSSRRGSGNHRRDILVDAIRELEGTAWHMSTSVWRIVSRQTAAALRDQLAAALDQRLDFLAVTPVGKSERFGDAALES